MIWIRISDPDMSGSWCIKRTVESMIRVDSSVSLINHDPDRSWITDPNPDHPNETQPHLSLRQDEYTIFYQLECMAICLSMQMNLRSTMQNTPTKDKANKGTSLTM